jgi:nucleoside-diphosphate-sugar epimerase
MAEAPAERVRNEIFNVAAANGNCSKLELVELIRRNVPAMEIEYRDLSFGEDMRDVAVSCEKIDRVLGFRARRGVEDGIVEIRDAIESGLIKDPSSAKYRNHQFIVN